MDYYPVLDHGFVALVDHMGDDQAIERAARVSYGEGTRKRSETEGLIRYLMRHRHTTPFEMVEFVFHCAMPIFVARQWIRHRTANVNEYSGRYSVIPNTFHSPDYWRYQSKTNKQGSDGLVMGTEEEYVDELYNKRAQDSFNHYNEMVGGFGVAREQARIGLPLSTYTQWYWKIDLHNLLHFLSLRLDSHAQYEIRVFAQVMATLVRDIVPLTWRAFCDYRMLALNFSQLELKAMQTTPPDVSHFSSMREIREFEAKMEVVRGETEHPNTNFLGDMPAPITADDAQERLFPLREVT